MNTNHMAERYSSALEHYIAGRDETALHNAYELGRSALAIGLRSLDLVRMHHEQLSEVLSRASSRDMASDITAAASVFLVECLSPYEMTISGFREAISKLELEIGERRRVEQSLRESEEHFRSLIENSLDIVTILDSDGTVRYDSPAVELVLGYRPGELVGKNVFQFLHPDDIATIKGTFDLGIQIPNHTVSVQFRFKHKDGTWHVLEGRGKNLLKVPGIRGILVNSRDITESKLLQERLGEAARQRAEDLRVFAQSIQRAQEEERHRIARELHDDVCQTLSALKLHTNVFEDDIPESKRASRKRLYSIKKQLDDLIEDVRRISSNLRPIALDHFGLVTALRLLCLEFEKVHNKKVHLETAAVAPGGYGMQVDITVYRIAQEALTNVAKHSKAKTVWVSLSSNRSVLKLMIQDDGQGFRSRARQQGRRQGMGMMSMKERTELLGGIFSATSAQNKGLTLNVELPIFGRTSHEENQTPYR